MYTLCCIETDGSPAPIPPSSSMGLARTIQRNLEKARPSSPVKSGDSPSPSSPVVAVTVSSSEASAVSEVTTSTLINGTTQITEVSADITTTSTGTNCATNGSVNMAPAVVRTPVVPIPTAGLSFSERTDLLMSGVMDQMALIGLAQSQQKQARQSEQQPQQQSAQQDGDSPLPPSVPESEPDLLIEDTGRTSTSSYMSCLFDQDPPPPPITPIAPVITTPYVTPTRRMNSPSPSPSDVTTSSYINDNTIIDPPLGGPIVPTFTPIFTPKDDKVVLTPAAKESLTASNNATSLNECKLSNHRVNAGCAAIVVLKVNNILYIANAGDSRAVLCRAGGVAYSLSYDHKPYEVSRV